MPDEVIIKFRQNKSEDGTRPQSYFTYPSARHFPKNFYTKSSDLVKPDPRNNLCVITNQPEKYRDPLTGQSYATLDAFKILREKFFQKEEERLFLRI